MTVKEDIIKAIQDTAENGVPLGIGRFRQETGITLYDINKYWPKFSDAQKDAGFQPNTLQIGYGEEFIIQK